jgi:hypothetical protein
MFDYERIVQVVRYNKSELQVEDKASNLKVARAPTRKSASTRAAVHLASSGQYTADSTPFAL